QCRLTHLTAPGKDLVEGRVSVDVAAHVLAVEDLLPFGKWVRFAQHEGAHDEELDVRQVPEHPDRMAAAVAGREDEAMLPHVFDAGENSISALLQIVAQEIDGLHVSS